MSDEIRDFRCEWRIDVAASTAREAALKAELLMRDSLQSCWTVIDPDGGDETNVEVTEE